MNNFVFKNVICSLVELDIIIHGKAILEFFKNNSDFFKLCEGREPDQKCLDDFFTDAPANYLSKKKAWGCFVNSQLRAVIDYIEGYPDDKTVFGGLLLVDQLWRGQGFGQCITQVFRSALLEKGFQKVRIAVLEQNINALKVWKGAGFKEVLPRKKKKFGELESVVVFMEIYL